MLSVRQFLVPLLYLTVPCKIQPSTSLHLRLRHHNHRPSTAFVDVKIHGIERKIRQTRLFSRKVNDDGDGGKRNRNKTKDNADTPMATTPLSPDVALLMDPGLWTSDFLALILASQLIGLLNVINSPEFIANGGWFQPIPAVPSTLDDLVQRISSFAITWAIASTSVVSLTKTTANDAVQQNSSDEGDTSIILQKNIESLAVFGILQIIGNGIVSGLEGANDLANIDGNPVMPWWDIVRNCYYVGLSTSGLRYLYDQYFLAS